ncbi:MAG: hypothetical protein AAGK78_00495 [Planctomycetota bacterium]
MALIDRLLGRNKSLSQLSRTELRREEILLTKKRDKLFARIDQIAKQKHQIFQQGKQSSSPELRKALAQDFEMKTTEQLMAARELNLRSKELLTVARVRMAKENHDRGKAAAKGLGRLNLTTKDMTKLAGWLESDAVSQEVYAERLDQLLEIGSEADLDAIENAGLSSAGQDLMHLWDQLDQGQVEETDAYEQAEAAARRKAGGSSEPQRQAAAEQS